MTSADPGLPWVATVVVPFASDESLTFLSAGWATSSACVTCVVLTRATETCRPSVIGVVRAGVTMSCGPTVMPWPASSPATSASLETNGTPALVPSVKVTVGRVTMLTAVPSASLSPTAGVTRSLAPSVMP